MEGWDGLTFENGLPEKGELVEVKTVWSGDEWEEKIYRGYIGYKDWGHSYYPWFGVYSKPNLQEGSLPIVLQWRRKK